MMDISKKLSINVPRVSPSLRILLAEKRSVFSWVMSMKINPNVRLRFTTNNILPKSKGLLTTKESSLLLIVNKSLRLKKRSKDLGWKLYRKA